MKDGNVSLNSLLKNEIYLRITPKLMKILVNKRKKSFKNIREIATAIHEPEKAVTNFFWQPHAIPLNIFLKLVKLFKIGPYEKEIVWLGGKTRGNGIFKPRLPFNFNTEEGGIFIAAVLGDGHFDHNFEIAYYNHAPLMLNRIIAITNKLFGKVDIVYKDSKSIVFPKILGKIIYILGLRPGRKTVINPSIPKFIMGGSEECKIGFLKQISDDEGSAQINPPYSYSIRYEFAREIPYEKISEKEKYVPILLLDLYKLIRSLDYSTTNIYGGRVYKGRKKPRFVVSWAFDIQGKLSLEKFANEINFRIPKRKEKLAYGLSRIRVETYGKNAQNVALKYFYEIFKQKEHVTKQELSIKLKRTIRNAQDWLFKLENEGLIKRCGGNRFIGGSEGFCSLIGKTPLEYVMTKKGATFLKKIKTSSLPKIKVCPINKKRDFYICKWSSNN